MLPCSVNVQRDLRYEAVRGVVGAGEAVVVGLGHDVSHERSCSLTPAFCSTCLTRLAVMLAGLRLRASGQDTRR